MTQTKGESTTNEKNEATKQTGIEETNPSTEKVVEEKETEIEELSEEEKLKLEITEKDKKIKDLEDKLLRLHAQIRNTEKQIKKDAEIRIFESKKRLLRYSISVKDNIDRALSLTWPENTDTHREGIQLISTSIDELFDMSGVVKIKAMGEMYDIVKHEAVGSTPYNGPENRVIEVVEKGFLLDGKVLRPAKVIVSVKEQKTTKKEEQAEDKSELKKESSAETKSN